MGERIYNKKCTNIIPSEFTSFTNLKVSIKSKNLCQSLNDKHLEAVSLYLCDVKRIDVKTSYDFVNITALPNLAISTNNLFLKRTYSI